MNSVHLSGMLAFAPVRINHGKGLHFVLKVPYPNPSSRSGTGFKLIPCGVAEVSPEQRDILLGKGYLNYRVEINGRLGIAQYENPAGELVSSIEIIVQPNGLLLQRVK